MVLFLSRALVNLSNVELKFVGLAETTELAATPRHLRCAYDGGNEELLIAKIAMLMAINR